MPSYPEQNYNCACPFFQNSLSSAVLLIGLQQDFHIRDCSSLRKQAAGTLKRKSTPEVWKPEYGFSFLLYLQFGISGCLVEQKWIWDLFWCGLDSAPVWTDLPALLYWSGRAGWVWACSEPQQRHMAGVSIVCGSFLQKALSFSFALLNFLGDGIDLASFAFTCGFFPCPEQLEKNWHSHQFFFLR